MKQKYFILFTGLSGSGKSTLAKTLHNYLKIQDESVESIDFSRYRRGPIKSKPLFSVEQHRRLTHIMGEAALLLYNCDKTVILSTINPYSYERDRLRNMIGKGKFCEIYISTSIEECVKRDPKNMYKKYFEGSLKGMPGLDTEYEIPLSPDIVILNEGKTIEEGNEEIVNLWKCWLAKDASWHES